MATILSIFIFSLMKKIDLDRNRPFNRFVWMEKMQSISKMLLSFFLPIAAVYFIFDIHWIFPYDYFFCLFPFDPTYRNLDRRKKESNLSPPRILSIFVGLWRTDSHFVFVFFLLFIKLIMSLSRFWLRSNHQRSILYTILIYYREKKIERRLFVSIWRHQYTISFRTADDDAEELREFHQG